MDKRVFILSALAMFLILHSSVGFAIRLPKV